MKRDELGKLVRDTWVVWASEQTEPKASWLVPWERLPENDREVDRRIGETVFRAAMDAARGLPALGPWRPDCDASVDQVVAVIGGPVYVDRVLWWRDRLAACGSFDNGQPVGLPPVLVVGDGRIVNGNHRALVAAEFGVRLWGLVVEPGTAGPGGGPRPWVVTGNVCQVLPAERWPVPIEWPG